MSAVWDSTLRVCDWPTCGASYDATKGPAGQAPGHAWRNHLTFGLHLCGDHAPAWGSGDGPHAPHLDHATSKSACNCGTPLLGLTLGEMGDAYIIHLSEVTLASLKEQEEHS